MCVAPAARLPEEMSGRGVAILEAAAQTFPGNADIGNSLAGAYLQAGQPKRAVTIYESLDLSNATLAQYRGAIGAALAARDMKAAELWLQAALDLYKDDAAILKMAAQFEQARGDPLVPLHTIAPHSTRWDRSRHRRFSIVRQARAVIPPIRGLATPPRETS